MQRHDIIIVGSGPAGISAAITAKLRNKSILLFGQGGISKKVSAPVRIRNYPGFPDISGEKLHLAFQEHLRAMGIFSVNRRVDGIYPMGDYFSVLSGSDIYEARSIILATGVTASRTIPGETQLLGKGVSYCATCDGFLYENGRIVCITFGPSTEREVRYLADITKEVVLLPQYDGTLSGDNMETVKAKPKQITKSGDQLKVVTDVGELTADGVFILREDLASNQLLPGLATENGFIKVDRQMCTQTAGCFACGDCVGVPFQYIKAAGEGNVAALSAVAYLSQYV